MKKYLPLYLLFLLSLLPALLHGQSGTVTIPAETYKELIVTCELLRQNSIQLSLLLQELLKDPGKISQLLTTLDDYSAKRAEIEKRATEYVNELQKSTEERQQDLNDVSNIVDESLDIVNDVENSLQEKVNNVWVERVSIGVVCLALGFVVGLLF